MAASAGVSMSLDKIEKMSEDRTRDHLINDISLMLAYALTEGLELDAQTANLAGASADFSSFSGCSPSELVSLHNALARAVAPATPGSLEATEPVRGAFGFLRRPPVIGWMVLAALSCAAGFVLAISLKWPTVNWVCGAGLGSAFYGLFAAHDYVKQRTFDPRYNSVYMIRFVLGVVAGIILANLPIFANDGATKNLGQGVIALLGGFSAEAVNQVLQRLVDILVAVVNGSGSDAARAEVEQVKTKAAAQVATAKQSLSQELADMMSTPGLQEDLRARLKSFQSNLK